MLYATRGVTLIGIAKLLLALISMVLSENAIAQEVNLITGPELQAGAVALAKFTSDEKRADISNYRVFFKESLSEFEIIFIPNQPEQDVSAAGHQLVVGGETHYGREIHYFVSKGTFELLRRSFAR